MNKQVASEVINLMVEFGGELNQSVALVQSQCSEDEFQSYKTTVSKIMGTMLLDIMNPIFDEYPDLKPDGLK